MAGRIPFIAHPMLGIAQGGGGRRNETLTKDTKTTFSLNWGFCENGTGHPVACSH